jgi:hypothetical protein
MFSLTAPMRSSAIAAEMGQLKNEIQERRRVLDLFLINVKRKNIIKKIYSLLLHKALHYINKIMTLIEI